MNVGPTEKTILAIIATVFFVSLFFAGRTAYFEKRLDKKAQTIDSLRAEADSLSEELDRRTGPVSLEEIGSETLWLARIAYSETDRRYEMVKVAWSARNRVETCYRGCSYEAVAKWPDQYSGLDPTHPRYEKNMKARADTARLWRTALKVAKAVRRAPASLRPFPKTTRHFYSPVSMKPAGRVPGWAAGRSAIAVVNPSKQKKWARFAFFDNVK